jgi:hypothetical protein
MPNGAIKAINDWLKWIIPKNKCQLLMNILMRKVLVFLKTGTLFVKQILILTVLKKKL